MIKMTDKSGETGKLMHCYRDVKCAAALENSLVVLQNIRHRVTINPAILLQDIYPRKMKTNIYTKSCMQMFVVTLFIIIKQNKSNYE